jgi:MSHA biogenesis protein MshG
MPFFSYRGRNARGELVRGVIENIDSSAVADQLINSGISPIDIAPSSGTGQVTVGSLGRLFRGEKIDHEDVLLFSRQMYTLLKSGVPILRALAGLQESSTKPGFAAVLQDVRYSLDSGRELSASMIRHPRVFSSFYVSMVRVGELTGSLDEIFNRLFSHLEFEKEIREKVTAALRYPAFVIAVMAIAITVINLFVIPAFVKVYAGFKAELPLMTQALIGFSNFMVRYWAVILVAIVACMLLARWYVSTRRGRYNWDRIKLRIPIAGSIVLKATLARFSRSLSLALKSGVPVVQALSVVANVVDNTFMAQRIEQMRDAVERGESLVRTATITGVFTPVVLQMISVGEESGEIDDLLQEVADMYQRDVEYQLKSLSSQIEPILIVILGAFVLVLALGIFLPIWNLGEVALKR